MNLLNVKNLKKDFKDPDFGSYGKKLPVFNKKVMEASVALGNKHGILDALARLIPGRKVSYDSANNPGEYHRRAQAFIKASHAQGRKVQAEGSELTAYGKGTYLPKKAQETTLKQKYKPGPISDGTGVGP